MKKLKFARVIALVLASMTVLTACGSQPAKSGAPNGTASSTKAGGEKVVTMAMTSVWDTFMPLNTTSSHTDIVIDQMFDRLMVINKDGTFSPRLAESWEVNKTSDKITYHLNKNAKWHDGTPVTADDVVYTCQLASDPKLKIMRRIRMMYYAGTDESGAELSENSVGVKAIDKNTVEMTLKAPMDPMTIFALVNRDIFILPKHLLEKIPEAELVTNKFWLKPIGSGPFKFSSMISGERVELVANKDYYMGAPDFDRFIIRVMPSANLLAGLMSGEIDLIAGGASGNIPLQDWDAAKKVENITCESIPSLGYQYMAINTSKDYLPKEVRQAINIAINRDIIIKQLMKGEGVAAIGPLPPTHQYFNKDMLPIQYDVEKAAQMVKNSGWDSNRVLNFLVPIGNEIREKSAPLIQQDLAKIGIKVKIQSQDFPTLLQAARDGKYDILLMGSAGSLDPNESVPNVTVGYMNNFAQLTDTTLGDLGKKGSNATNFEKRKPIYDQYQMTLKEQVPMVWLYFQNSLFAHSKRISNIPSTTTDFEINKKPWEWKVS